MSARDYDVKWALAPTKKESAYDTQIVNGDLTAAWPFKDLDLADFNLDLMSDRDEYGRGHEWPTDTEIELKDAAFRRGFDLSCESLAWILAFGLGTVSSAQQGETAAYLHTIKPLAPGTSVQLPSLSVVEQLNTGAKRLFTGLCVSDFAISGEGPNGRLKLEANFMGSGTKAASSIDMPSLTAVHFLRMGDVTFSLGPSGSEVDISSRLKRFSFGWNNQLMGDDGYYPGTGSVRGRLEYGVKRNFTCSFTLRHSGDTTDHDYLDNQTELSLIVAIDTGTAIADSYNWLANLYAPKYVVTKLTPTIIDGLEYVDIEIEGRYDSTAVGPFYASVMTSETGYLTASS